MTKSLNNQKKEINPSDFVQSLDRGLKVIQTFSKESPKLTISEVAKKTDLSRPTARRILLTLESIGFVSSNHGYFTLTSKVLKLGYAFFSSNHDLWEIMYPIMKRFTNKTGESCSISVLDNMDIVYVARVHTKKIMSINIDVGTRFPAYATSMGHVLLSGLPEFKFKEYMNKVSLEPFTNYTVTNKKDLCNIINKVKDTGYAHVENQLENGLRSLAVPLFNKEGQMIAAINTSTHSKLISKEEMLSQILPPLLSASQEISKDIGSASF